MRRSFVLPIVLLVASCAPPAPEPIKPEPMYDKYGNVVYVPGDQPECRDGRDLGRYSTIANHEQIPICENTCQPGTAITHNQLQCVPVDRGGDDPQRRQGTTVAG